MGVIGTDPQPPTGLQEVFSPEKEHPGGPSLSPTVKQRGIA